MKSGAILLAAVAILWTALVTTADGRRQLPPPQAASTPAISAPVAPPPASTTSADYLGSAACRRCHEVEQEQWEKSLHVRMTKPVAQALVVGDFSEGTRFEDHGRWYTFGRKDGKPYIAVASGGRPAETFTVDYTLGAKRYQGYLSTTGGWAHLCAAGVLAHRQPAVGGLEGITPIPDGAHDLRQIWNANCFNCHGTNIVQGYDVETKRYNSTWTEMGIGCEACHGPGRPHVALMDEWEKNPASKPAYDNSAKNRGLTDILKVLSPRSADPRRVYDTCAYCHGNKTNIFVGFRGGDRYDDYALPFLVSGEIPSNDLQGEFWPDGRPNRFNRPQALTLSGCFQAGAIACTNCHVAHGSRNEHSLKVNIYGAGWGTPSALSATPPPRRQAVGPDAESARVATPSFSGAGLRRTHSTSRRAPAAAASTAI